MSSIRATYSASKAQKSLEIAQSEVNYLLLLTVLWKSTEPIFLKTSKIPSRHTEKAIVKQHSLKNILII